MKINLLIFSLLVLLAGCAGEEGSPLPSPCEVDTPVIDFKYEPGKITLTWDNIGDYVYSASYRIKSRPNEHYNIGNGYDTFAIITYFHPGTPYEVELSVEKSREEPTSLNRCNGEITQQTFTAPCGPYTSLHITTSASTAKISWDRAAEPLTRTFTVNLRKKGTTDVTFFGTDEEFVELTSLDSKTEYEVQLASACTDDQVYVSDWFGLTTL